MKRLRLPGVAAASRMDVLVALLHISAFVALGIGLAVPAVRRAARWLLAAAAVASVAVVVAAPEVRSLTTVHTYAGFQGDAQEVSMVSFPTGTVQAPGWQWALPFLAFAAGWIVVLLALKDRPLRSALLLPLAFAWSATAAWIAMQLLAAPASVVQPLGLDRFLFPAGLAAALVAARTIPAFLRVFVTISASTIVARLPAALFSKYASDHGLGTSLDVSTIRDIVNPMTQMQFEPRLVLGSGQQQFWLIWLEHVLVFPTLYLLSLVGIAFGVFMFHHHSAESHPTDDHQGQRAGRT